MTNRISALEALDDLFSVIRRAADENDKFAAEIVQSLSVPIRIEFEPKSLTKTLPYLDPIIIAGEGLDEFRRIFRPLTDAQMRKIITHFNIASKDDVPARGGPKGEDLFELLWNGASRQRARLSR